MKNNSKNIVSYDHENLIIVDFEDNEIGNLSKLECHKNKGVLHRAFSIFLFNTNGQLLIQKRSSQKKLWPLFWSNTCCSHPRKGEEILNAAHRRLSDELGIKKVTLEYVYKFSYTAEYKNIGSENELCSVFLGKIDEDLDINENEISLVKYIETRDLLSKMENKNQYTPWFEMEWHTLSTTYQKTLRQYTTI